MWLGINEEGGFKNQPVGKGQRLTVCHTSSGKTGFVPEAKFIFKALKAKDTDYHNHINRDTYMAWFSDLLNVLEPRTLAYGRGHEVITLPPYHCQYNSIELIWAQVKEKKKIIHLALLMLKFFFTMLLIMLLKKIGPNVSMARSSRIRTKGMKSSS
ncbi:unnamed protein product [Pieris brassicae]|uniref:Tc1-like transposase DDE domain-containing protein n=1 Tax=Pieris brassicae TaxID=7116 RepID=A0A9P0XIS4_PIEBR|nr:unnamed protein product [Pieris brassicae]